MGAKREKARITSSIFLSSIQTVPEEITGNWHYRNIREGRGGQRRAGASREGQGQAEEGKEEQRKAGESRGGQGRAGEGRGGEAGGCHCPATLCST